MEQTEPWTRNQEACTAILTSCLLVRQVLYIRGGATCFACMLEVELNRLNQGSSPGDEI